MTPTSMTFTTRAKHRGFTLLEVMLGLALLAVGLVVLVKSAANSIFNTQQAHMMGVATDLSRAKMYELEEKLIKDGFSDLEQHEDDQPFTDEGWPSIHYSYKIEAVELPGWDQLQALVKQTGCKGSASGSGSASESGSASGSASGSGSDGASECGFENSALGGMMQMVGGGFGGGGGGSGKGSGGIGEAAGASFVQGQYQMFQQILKVSIRKVSLTLTWQVMGSDRDMKVVAFLTDAAAMDKVINGMGSQDLDDQAGSGSGKPSGLGGGSSGSNSPPNTRR